MCENRTPQGSKSNKVETESRASARPMPVMRTAARILLSTQVSCTTIEGQPSTLLHGFADRTGVRDDDSTAEECEQAVTIRVKAKSAAVERVAMRRKCQAMIQHR